MIQTRDFLWQEVFDLTFEDLATGEVLGTANQLQDMTISNSVDTVYALGKNQVKLGGFSNNKAVNITATSGMYSGDILALSSGASVESLTEAPVRQREVLTVASNAVTLTNKAVGTSGAEIGFVYKVTSSGGQGEKLEQAEAASSGHFAYDASTKKITFNSNELKDGERVIVYYNAKVSSAIQIVNKSDEFAKTVKVVGTAHVQDPCNGLDYIAYLEIPRARFTGNFDIALGNDPAVQNIEIEALADPCSTESALWKLTLYDGSDLVSA